MKPVRIRDRDGNQSAISIAELKAQKINRFKGWNCSIGRNSLHIDADGIVWVGVCRVGGVLGHIEHGWSNPPDGVVCERSQCNCGTEIKVPKTHPDFPELNDFIIEDTPEANLSDVVAVNYNHEMIMHVQWDLGRRCNFDCSYCPGGPTGVHNNFEPYKSSAVLYETVDRLNSIYSGKRIEFCFSGGEPTMHPEFINICRYIRDLGHRVHLTTNGSRGPGYWADLIKVVDYISISIHFEFYKIKNLMSIVSRQIEERIKTPDATARLEIKCMASPERWDEALALKSSMLSIPEFETYAKFYLSPLRVILGSNKMMDYTVEMIEQFG